MDRYLTYKESELRSTILAMDSSFNHCLTHILPLLFEATSKKPKSLQHDMTKKIIEELYRLQDLSANFSITGRVYTDRITEGTVQRELAKMELRRMDNDLF